MQKDTTHFFQTGFTLIELIVVFSIMVILSSIGVASFVSYSRSQSVDTSMKEFKTTLFTARSRALSQLRDDSCYANGFNGQGYTLQGYQVIACCPKQGFCNFVKSCSDSSDNYELQAVYAYPDGTGLTAQTCVGKKFTDPNISVQTIGDTTTGYFFFASVTGAVTTSAGSGSLAQLEITGYGITKIATVSSTGVIQ